MTLNGLGEKIKANKCLNVLEEVGLILLSFLLPFLLMLFVFKGEKIYPFGDKTLLMIDMQCQYISYMRYYKAVLSGNQSMIYTLSKVFGGDFMSIFTYYLASPFNLLLVFFPYSEIPAFFLWTNLLKIGFSGLNMYLLLRLSFKKRHISNLIFAVGYGLISYSVVYLLNFMWLDGVMILPVVILGIDFIFEKKQYWIYPISLAYGLFTSWYIGAMICMFSVFYFIYKFFALKIKMKERIPYLTRFFFFSLAGGFLAAVCWFTAFSHLSGTKAVASLPSPINYPFKMIVAGFLEDNYEMTGYICHNDGYITMFTSVVTLVFFQLFFFNKEYQFRERIGALVLFLFYILCSVSSLSNALLHGGREPTWFPGRYSFVIGFMVCYFGAKGFSNLKKTPVFASLLPLVTGLIVLFLVKGEYSIDGNVRTYIISKPSIIIYYVVALSIIPYLVISDLKPKYQKLLKYVVSIIAIPLTCVSSFRGAKYVVHKNENAFQKIEKYQEDEKYTSDFENIKSLENNTAFRMEATFNRPGNYNDIDNNPMFYSYNGLSHYSSSSLKQVEEYMIKLGFHYNGFFEKYDSGSTASANSFLNIKYLIDKSKDASYNKPKFMTNYPYEEITSISSENEGIKYYQNTLTLPFGFASDKLPYEWFQDNERIGDKLKYYDHFEYQNSIYKSLCGNIIDENEESKDIFYRVPVVKTVLSSGIEVVEDEAGNKFYTGPKGSTIRITYKVPEFAKDFNLYFSEMNINSKLNYTLDYRSLEINTYWHKNIKSVTKTISGEHELVMSFNQNLNNEIINEGLYFEDTNVLKEYVDEIRIQGANDLQDNKGATSFNYSGTFNLTKDNQQLFFTIPFEDEINVYVDGKKLRTFKCGHIFVGADLTGVDKGLHKVKIEYVDKGLKKGIAISLTGFVLTIGGVLFFDRLETKIVEEYQKGKEKRKWKKKKPNLD